MSREISLEISELAGKTIAAMRDRTIDVRDQFGERSSEYVEMMGSLLTCMTTMFRLGGIVSHDSDLSLYVVSPHLHYGVNFRPTHRDDVGSPRDLLGTWSVNS